MRRDGLILDRFLPYRLSYTAGLLSELIAKAYRAHFDLSIAEWRVLAHVAERPGISQQDIGDRTRMDKVMVSRAAKSLHAKGLLERAASGTDRRALILRLSPSGKALFDRIAPKALELEAGIAAALSASEIRELHDMLARIDAAAAARLDGKRV
ncbi:MarR family transcriptional regulator [Sphingobium amiense]|uniref:MarR family transcriptional regulator n=2 Tax=Sphingobium amiense TaxID=135719 RepID=A0A494W5K0_9SPHN|nr:MarR family winged helix-turn-helix transcriptional regulator [Sphingobium amiense]BBD99501.1 MarR family transcriptional regulator [Sphingobium amiense]